jgi:hypothetical protein
MSIFHRPAGIKAFAALTRPVFDEARCERAAPTVLAPGFYFFRRIRKMALPRL